MHENENEAISAIAVAGKSIIKQWFAEHFKSVFHESGSGVLKMAATCGGANELQDLRRTVANSKRAPTVPMGVPVRESSASDGMEKAVRIRSRQFRNPKSHLECGLKA